MPFGEFIPLRPLLGWFINGVLNIPMGDLARGDARQAPLAVAGQKVAVNICYEDVFGEEIIRALPQATLLVNVTNDAWYGYSPRCRAAQPDRTNARTGNRSHDAARHQHRRYFDHRRGRQGAATAAAA